MKDRIDLNRGDVRVLYNIVESSFTKNTRSEKRDTKEQSTTLTMSQSYSSPIQFLASSPLSVYLRDRKELAVKAEERGEPTRGAS
jgi:hypothetical protein